MPCSRRSLLPASTAYFSHNVRDGGPFRIPGLLLATEADIVELMEKKTAAVSAGGGEFDY